MVAQAKVWMHYEVPAQHSLQMLFIASEESFQSCLMIFSQHIQEIFFGHVVCTAYLRSTHRLSMMLKSRDCEGHSKSFSLQFLKQFWWILRYVLDHCPYQMQKPILVSVSHLLTEFADISWNPFFCLPVQCFLCQYLPHSPKL